MLAGWKLAFHSLASLPKKKTRIPSLQPRFSLFNLQKICLSSNCTVVWEAEEKPKAQAARHKGQPALNQGCDAIAPYGHPLLCSQKHPVLLPGKLSPLSFNGKDFPLFVRQQKNQIKCGTDRDQLQPCWSHTTPLLPG